MATCTVPMAEEDLVPDRSPSYQRDPHDLDRSRQQKIILSIPISYIEMRLLVCSVPDRASVTIRDTLLEMVEWSRSGELEGNTVWKFGENTLVSIDRLHLLVDDIDQKVTERTGQHFEDVVFLSRHKAVSGIHTLTVHPLGNYEKAEFGGKDRTLVPSSPYLMTSLLRRLKGEVAGLPFEVSFEVTHHGPSLQTPALFIEIGSDETMWADKGAARAIASSILNVEKTPGPVAIGIGGGHYAARFSEVVQSKNVSFGHMIPNYFVEKADEQATSRYVQMALEGTKCANSCYIHKKSMKRSRATSLKNLIKGIGLEVIDSEDLSDI